MSDDEIVLNVTDEDGIVEQERVKRNATELDVRFSFSLVVASRISRSPQLVRRQLVAVSDNIAQLTLVTKLWVRPRCFVSWLDPVSTSSIATPSPRSLRAYLP